MPPKPIRIAVQRRHPTGSPKNTALASVTVSGSICKSAVTLAIGMLKSAVRKNQAAATSATARKAIRFQSRAARSRVSAFIRRATR